MAFEFRIRQDLITKRPDGGHSSRVVFNLLSPVTLYTVPHVSEPQTTKAQGTLHKECFLPGTRIFLDCMMAHAVILTL